MDLDQRPQAVNQVAGQLLPAAILLFNGLKRAYACRAEHENDEDDDEEGGEEEDETGKWAFAKASKWKVLHISCNKM